MQRFRSIRNLQNFAAFHTSALNHFNHERSLYSGVNFKLNRAAALSEGRQRDAA